MRVNVLTRSLELHLTIYGNNSLELGGIFLCCVVLCVVLNDTNTRV
jgi:hypothetical protein